MDLIKKMSKFGIVKSCKLINENVAMIFVVNCSEKANDVFAFLKECKECFPEHKILETFIIEQGFSLIVLNKYPFIHNETNT